jgi:hypothetical protein
VRYWRELKDGDVVDSRIHPRRDWPTQDQRTLRHPREREGLK